MSRFTIVPRSGMVAFIFSLVLTAVMVGIIVAVGRRRPVGTPLTWGEAFVAGTFVFALLFVVYGVVPHQWLAWADNELKWRTDTYGIPLGPLGKLGLKNPAFQDGITFFGRGRLLVNAQTLRDIIEGTIYIVFLVLHALAWLWWQRRGAKASAEQTAIRTRTSAYGRPLVRKV